MPICINCGSEAENCLCAKCKDTVNIEELCEQLTEYRPGLGENALWDSISANLSSPYNFRNIIFAVTDSIPSPRKEYRRILGMVGDSTAIAKNSRPWLYEAYDVCKKVGGLSEYELNRIKGLVLDALYKDYMFAEADELATDIMESDNLPKQVYFTVADFYTKTRRYDEADEILSEANKLFGNDQAAVAGIKKLADDNNKQREKAESGKQEYMPNPKEDKDVIRKKYVDFLATLGIEAEVPATGSRSSRGPKAIPRDQYPDPVETRDAEFDSFVAFDLETTGRSSKIDSIIEFGAIKVVNGQVVDSGEFVFQEFVKPYKRKLSDEIQNLTGITADDVKDAREMWEVTPDFLKFVGDSILVGFNCIAFDSRFMVRAGRYSNIIIENKYFDVMRYADQFKERLGIDGKKISLEELSDKLGVQNPEAHRALADAITTARVFLKLKEMDDGAASSSLDDMLSGFEDF